MEEDSYRTIESTSLGIYKDKGSKFISFAIPVKDSDEAKIHVEKLRKEYHDARHHCYAYMLGRSRDNWRVNDDGEPSGTAGKPILGQINAAGLTNILIVVVRYFGGILLGTSGLITAYRASAADALRNAAIVEKMLRDYFEVTFPYKAMNEVMKVLKEESAGQSERKFDDDCKLVVDCRSSARQRLIDKIERIGGTGIRFIEQK